MTALGLSFRSRFRDWPELLLGTATEFLLIQNKCWRFCTSPFVDYASDDLKLATFVTETECFVPVARAAFAVAGEKCVVCLPARARQEDRDNCVRTVSAHLSSGNANAVGGDARLQLLPTPLPGAESGGASTTARTDVAGAHPPNDEASPRRNDATAATCSVRRLGKDLSTVTTKTGQWAEKIAHEHQTTAVEDDPGETRRQAHTAAGMDEEADACHCIDCSRRRRQLTAAAVVAAELDYAAAGLAAAARPAWTRA